MVAESTVNFHEIKGKPFKKIKIKIEKSWLASINNKQFRSLPGVGFRVLLLNIINLTHQTIL